jgi:hypothetical protein
MPTLTPRPEIIWFYHKQIENYVFKHITPIAFGQGKLVRWDDERVRDFFLKVNIMKRLKC